MASAMWVLMASFGMMLVHGAFYAGSFVKSWRGSATKTLSVLGIAAAGLALGAPILAVVGVLLGALGDFALSRPGDRAFLLGMAAFALGHLAYAGMFWAVPRVAGQGLPNGVFGWAAMVGLLGLMLSTEVWLAPHTGALRWAVRGYIAVIGSMAAAAILLGPGFAMVKLGVGLFVASDVMIALEKFVVRAPRLRWALARALWPAYWLGQAMIVVGIVLGGALGPAAVI